VTIKTDAEQVFSDLVVRRRRDEKISLMDKWIRKEAMKIF
jgi:hypothetical protein